MIILSECDVIGRAFSLLCVASLGGCGFQLEGAGTLPAATAVTYVDTTNTHTEFYGSLADALRARGVEVADSPQDAGAILRILSDSSGQRMLSVSARNIPREYEVYYSVTFSFDVEGEGSISPESMTATRNYTFDETLVLGKSSEQAVLRQSLADDLARQVLRRIAADRGRVAAVRQTP
jgi:LPS-assembly lipoprotein